MITNLDKYIEVLEGREEDPYCYLYQKRTKEVEGCHARYHECKNCIKDTIKWLFREHTPVKITQEEKSYIRHIVNPIKNKANYICKTNNSIKIFGEQVKEPLVTFLVTDELSFSEWEENKVYTIKELYLW